MKIQLLLLIYFVCVFGENNSDRNKFRSDYVFDENLGLWVKVHFEALDAAAAFNKCSYEGAEKTLVLAPQVLKTLGIGPQLATKKVKPGIPLSYIHLDNLLKVVKNVDWNVNDSECFHLYEEGLNWDADCSELHPFMCLKKPQLEDVVNECGTIDNGYLPQWPEVSPRHCHKYHWEYATWPEAQDICRAEGGYLTVINSIDEALSVNETFTFYRPLFNVTEAVWIGYREWAPGDWWTVHGQSLEEAGFREWCSGCPAALQKEASAALFCGAFANGWLEDAPCKDRRNFICEKRADSLTDKSRPYLY